MNVLPTLYLAFKTVGSLRKLISSLLACLLRTVVCRTSSKPEIRWCTAVMPKVCKSSIYHRNHSAPELAGGFMLLHLND